VLGDDGVDVSLLELLGVRDGQLTDARRELPDVLQELPEIQGGGSTNVFLDDGYLYLHLGGEAVVVRLQAR